GTVLDPIVSLRHRVRLRPGQTVRVVFSTLVAPSRDEAVALADKYRDAATFDRAATLAWTQAQVQLHHLGVKPDEAHLFQSLAAHILYPQRTLRASADVLARHVEGPAALWAHGISGDTPIVLVRIDEVDDVEIVRQLLRAHEYWRMKQLAVDLVILNEHAPSYLQDLQTLLETVVRTSPSYAASTGRATHGGVFIVRADLTTAAQRDVLQAAARAILLSRRGTLSEQVLRAERAEPAAAPPARHTAVRGPAGEFVDGRDDETGEVWSATALPIRQDSETYVARHGQGYSRFTHRSHGVAFELLQLVPLDDPVKICRLTLTNASGRRRR